MPSGPKKRRAARRKKQKMAISESQSNPNSNYDPFSKEVDDENEEVFRTPRSEPEIPLSESESVYYSVKNHSRRGSSDEFKSLDFDDNSQEKLNDFKTDEKDNINVNFDDRSREEEFDNEREYLKEHKLNECTYVTEEELEVTEQKMSFDDKNVKILPWLGESICTEDFLNANGTVDEASKELHISVDENSEKVDSDMALKNREISRDTITNVMEEKLDNEKGILLIEKSDSSDEYFVEAIGISPVNLNNHEVGLWRDKEIQNIVSDENRNSKAELQKELSTVHGNYKDLDLSVAAKDECLEVMKFDEFLHVTDNKSSTDEDKLQIEVGQQIIEKSLPFDEKTALNALVKAVAVSPSKENELKVVPWLYNDIPTEYVDVNVDVEVLHPEKKIAGFDSIETFNICQECNGSKCTSFESLDGSIRHNISYPKNPKGSIEVQEMLPDLENSAERSFGTENQQIIISNKNPKELNGDLEMHPQIEVDLINNEPGKFIEKSSRLVDSSILVCDEKSLHDAAIENSGEQEEDIPPPIESSKDSVNRFNTENLKDLVEVQEILLPLTDVKLISNDLGKSVEKSLGLVESSILTCEEEGLNVTAIENSVEQEEDILSLVESFNDSVNIFNTENPKDSVEVQEILPLTDAELICNDFGRSVEKSSGLVESSILTCEEEGLNVTAIENSVEQEEDILPLVESFNDSVNIFNIENSKDSVEVQEILPLTDAELISNDFGGSVENSSGLVESSILTCEEEGLNVTAIENSVEQEDILPLIESPKNSVNIFNTEDPNYSAEVHEIRSQTDVELISNDFDKFVGKSLELVESSIPLCEEEGLNVTAIKNSVEQEDIQPLIESPKDSVKIFNTENTNDSAEVQEISSQTDEELTNNDLGRSVEKSSRLIGSSVLIYEEEGLYVTATENSVEQEEDVLPVIESAKDSSVHTNQEIHHHTDMILTSDELHKSIENSSKYVENVICEEEGLPFVNVEKLNKEIHIDTASSKNSIDMVQKKLSSDSVNNQSDETADKRAGLDEDFILNSEGINQNSHAYMKKNSSNSSQPSMKESAEFSSNSGQTDNMKKNEVSPKAVRPHTTIWNCCGLLEAFTSSDR